MRNYDWYDEEETEETYVQPDPEPDGHEPRVQELALRRKGRKLSRKMDIYGEDEEEATEETD